MMIEKEPEYIFKCIVVGNAYSGKTSIINQFIFGRHQQFSYCIMEFPTKNIFVQKQLIKLQLWDTHGSERYNALSKQFYKGALGALVVFDITNKDTFDALDKWIYDVREYARNLVQIIVIGNKLDLNKARVVTKEEAHKFCEKNYVYYMETSALTGEYVDYAFKQLAEKILYNIDVMENLQNAQVQEPQYLSFSSQINFNFCQFNC